MANQEELDRLIYAEIRERRTAPDLAERTDVLSRLIREGQDSDDPTDRLDDTELRDQLVTLLLAGHETTATALSWALYELGRDPELMRRTQAAADAGDADGDAWLDAVMKESMRLHPVIPIVVRTLQKPATIAGYRPPGRRHRRAVDRGRARRTPTTTAPRSSTRPGSSARTRRPTPGSRSAAASAAASAPASR